ncbi:MAG: GH92 family glycosyl hydrolase [Candidatus Marinimicrobia bacterium]|nr:GH92 family glycosyl hydrolase [Candidatus Neomarinimicrobiota bacterium]MCF7880136.1 GH92 family glycosyl hydrolase [Candidatus Neomarinimicrobiota bacterium]
MGTRIYQVALLAFISVVLVLPIDGRADESGDRLTSYINPFIGTAGGGNTFPGAVRPWGLVSISPHTDPGAPSGYIYGEPWFYGLGHAHLSGTGCADLGSIILTAGRGNISPFPDQYRTKYDNEIAAPGYYAVDLPEHMISLESSASLRVGLTRITSHKEGQFHIILDAGRSLGGVEGGEVSVVSANEIEGYNISGGFCGEDNRQKVFFVARFNRSASKVGTWAGGELSNEKLSISEEMPVGAWMRFSGSAETPLLVKVGISYVSIENARENLREEMPGWDFESVRSQASDHWQEVLSKIRIKASKGEKTKFYTALYHALIHPNIISDVNGEYPEMGHHDVGRNTERPRYSVLSLWDTYRTLHPFLTLVYPQRQEEIIQSMLDMYLESGYLPKWELVSNETYMMVGDPAPIVIADSYIKGVRGFDDSLAFEAMLKPAQLEAGQDAPPIRAGYHELLEYGYIPFDQDTSEDWWVWGPVSTSLEYNLSDFAISQMAQTLGRTSIAQEFSDRAKLYRNLFDKQSLFMRPRKADSTWLDPFDPLATEGSGYWEGSGGPGYVEGNAWQYTWFVQHDVPGLIDLFGGEKPFSEKLSSCFDEGHFTINNEPDIAYPYLFRYVPEQAGSTPALIREIMETSFGTGPDGLPGNDDAGTISAWYLFSSLGFYPVELATSEYVLGEPQVRKAVVTLDEQYYSGDSLIIERVKNEGKPGIKWNDKTLDTYRIDHSRLTSGGKLGFKIHE